MRKFSRYVWEEQRAVVFCVLIAVILFGMFAYNFVSELAFFADPVNLNRPVEPWMSMRLVARSWDIPKEVMIEALGYQANTPIDQLPRTVNQYLIERGLSVAEFQLIIEETQQSLSEKHKHD